MPMENFKSCDTKGVAKPALAAYEPLFHSFAEEDQKWFGAAHFWDVSAAKMIGYASRSQVCFCDIHGC